MNCGKAPGKDGLPAEIFKALGDTAFQAFHDVLCTIWEDEDMPADLRDATIVALYKNKGAKGRLRQLQRNILVIHRWKDSCQNTPQQAHRKHLRRQSA